jgi:hypothetical protein
VVHENRPAPPPPRLKIIVVSPWFSAYFYLIEDTKKAYEITLPSVYLCEPSVVSGQRIVPSSLLPLLIYVSPYCFRFL